MNIIKSNYYYKKAKKLKSKLIKIERKASTLKSKEWIAENKITLKDVFDINDVAFDVACHFDAYDFGDYCQEHSNKEYAVFNGNIYAVKDLACGNLNHLGGRVEDLKN